MKRSSPEKGTMIINGHTMAFEIIRSEKPSAFGVYQSRIYEMNIFRDGTLTADFNKKWIKVPNADDEETPLAIGHLIDAYGKEKIKIRKEK